jgi:hypothetical protein
MCPNEKMTVMANLIIELVCAWLNLTGYLSVVKVESQRLFTFKNSLIFEPYTKVEFASSAESIYFFLFSLVKMFER